MPMIPLPIVLALVLGYFLLVELTQPAPRNRFAIAFLALVMLQLCMVGLRFGYGLEELGRIFPITASLIGPLAFLSFYNPASFRGKQAWLSMIHLLPLSVAILLVLFAPWYIDLAQGLFTLVYAVALIILGLNERDTFPWVDFNRREYVIRALWSVVVLALISSATDFVIAVDGWRSQGTNIPRIVSWTSTVMALLFIPFITWQRFRTQPSTEAIGNGSQQGDSVAESELMAQIDNLIASSQIHLDPDLNLNRMARKLGVPARQVSVAINRQREMSVSQFVNRLRIDEACRLLQQTDLPVTQVMLQSGFVTKSNFNREFSRRLGQSPSAWRNGNR